jgi:hypothetical protein
MCRLNIVGVILAFAEATSPAGSLMCNLAGEKSGAKSEPEFREAKVGCTQPPQLVLFFLLNASEYPLLMLLFQDSSLWQEVASTDETYNRGNGWLSNQTKPYPSDDYLENAELR